MQQLKDILWRILLDGKRKENRTGVDTWWVPYATFHHDMSDGSFPMMTTRRQYFGTVQTELAMFIRGVTRKEFLHERDCHIWDKWQAPGDDPNELGPIYGSQWRSFASDGYDQLLEVVGALRRRSTSRQLVVSAWSPDELDRMALPPCHFAFQFNHDGERLHLCWFQRSTDAVIGLPYDAALYGLLLRLVCKEVGIPPGTLTGQLSDTHIYVNCEDGVRLQLKREPQPLPTLELDNGSLWSFDKGDARLRGYEPHGAIKFDVAV